MATVKRLIDVDEVIKETESILNFRKQHHMPTVDYEALLWYLKNRPTVDAVEVVRCKDCKHYHPMKPYPSYNGSVNYCCRSGYIKVSDNDFCSYGEKREEHQQDCTYNKNGHCMGQKLMPECDPKNCDRRK